MAVSHQDNPPECEDAAQRPSQQVVDIAASLRRMGNNRELLRDLVAIYEEDSPGLVARIRGAIREGDAARLHRAAHSLKGLVSNFGASAAADAAYALETMGVQRNLSASEAALRRLQHELARLSQALAPYAASDKVVGTLRVP